MEEIKQESKNLSDYNSENSINYASFGERFLARIIDLILVSVVGYILIKYVTVENNFMSFVPIIFISVYCLLYRPLLEFRGGTFGKKIVKIKTIDISSNEPPTLGQSYRRTAILFIPFVTTIILVVIIQSATGTSPSFPTSLEDQTSDVTLVERFGRIIILVLLFLPYLTMLWSSTKQGWHDKFAKTIVIKSK